MTESGSGRTQAVLGDYDMDGKWRTEIMEGSEWKLEKEAHESELFIKGSWKRTLQE